MNIELLFPTAFGLITNPNHQHIQSKLVSKSFQLSETIESGGHFWESKKPYNTSDNKYNIINDEDFKELNNWVIENINLYTKKTCLKNKVKCEGGWLNIYKKGDYQEYHSHSYNAISAIYILKSPEKNSSKIFFKSPDMGRGQLLNDRKAMLNNEFQWVNDVNVYQPNEGTLIIFPSHILHSVSPHNSDDERITLAYNFENIK